MPLNTTTLAADIKKAFDDQSDKDINDAAAARSAQATALANAIEKFLKSGTVAISSITGSTTNAGAFTGTGSGTIS